MSDHILHVATVGLIVSAGAGTLDLWFLDGAYLPAVLLVAFVCGVLLAALTGIGPR